MTAVGIAALVVLVVVANALWLLSIRYAVVREKVDSPGDNSFDVLIHRDGVMLYTRAAGWANAYSVLPTLAALARRSKRGPWRWAVTVPRIVPSMRRAVIVNRDHFARTLQARE